MQRKSVVGTRSSLLWLLILGIMVLLIGAAVGALIVLPQLQAARTEQARLAEIERHYQAGIAFQNLEDWSAAEGEYRQVIALDATHRDVQDRMATVRARLKEVAATATTAAEAQAARARAEATATAQAAPAATQQALEARYQKGLGFMNLKRWEEAKAELETVFLVDPGFRDVQAKLKEVQQALDHLQSSAATPMPVSLTPVSPIASSATPKPPTVTPALTLKELDVQAKEGWQSTGLNLKVGQEVKITASGIWSHGPEGDVTPYYGPEGYEKIDNMALLPSSRVGTLIGRIGSGTPFVVGVSVSFVASSTGDLELSMNDVPGFFRDNDGSVKTQITVR